MDMPAAELTVVLAVSLLPLLAFVLLARIVLPAMTPQGPVRR
jgi:hypothetical protein